MELDLFNLFTDNPHIDVSSYVDSDLTIGEIEKIEKEKLLIKRKEYQDNHTIKDYFLGLDPRETKRAIFFSPYKDGNKVKYNTIALENNSLSFSKENHIYYNSVIEMTRIESNMVRYVKGLSKIANETKDMAIRLFNVPSHLISNNEMPNFNVETLKHTLDLDEFYPRRYDKNKKIKDLLSEIASKNKKSYAEIQENIDIANEFYKDKVFINKKKNLFAEIKDFSIHESFDSYSILANVNVIKFNKHSNESCYITYYIDSIKPPHWLCNSIYEPLSDYKVVVGKREELYDIIENLKMIESYKKKFNLIDYFEK